MIEEKGSFKLKSNSLLIKMTKQNGGSWAQLGYKEVQKKSKGDDEKMKDNPQGAMMDMMKKLYQDGDDDMKRMIAKSWTENQDKKEARGMNM